nr:glycosyltransferase [Microbacterium sp. CFH 90308]
MAPLGGLTVDLKDATFRSRAPGEPLVVAFIGRMARQKAPEVFAAMARRLHRTRRDIRFVMHGDGEMAAWVDDLLRSYGLEGVVARRGSSIPVADTLEEAHILVVPSHNEGLTLTTLEALAHGVPVISTDVGAQADIVPRRALVPRNAHRAARMLPRLVGRLADDEEARRQLWRDERNAEKKLLSNESASEWFAKVVKSW